MNGAKTAKVNYDIQSGWVAHHNSDLWAKTSPPGGWDKDPRAMPRWSAWPMAGVWLSTHLWEHYLFTGDKKRLLEIANELSKLRVADSLKAVAISTLDIKSHDKDKIYLF